MGACAKLDVSDEQRQCEGGGRLSVRYVAALLWDGVLDDCAEGVGREMDHGGCHAPEDALKG